MMGTKYILEITYREKVNDKVDDEISIVYWVDSIDEVISRYVDFILESDNFSRVTGHTVYERWPK
jgi:hypothetical protein